MSRERDGGRKPRKDPVDRLTPDRARDGKAEEPLRFGPEREPQGAPPKGGRPDWKKASTRKVRESAAIEQERREGMSPSRGDGQPLPEQAAPVFQDDPFRARARPDAGAGAGGTRRQSPGGGGTPRGRIAPIPTAARHPACALTRSLIPPSRSRTRLRPPKAPGLLAGGLLRPRRPVAVWDKLSRRIAPSAAPAASSERRATRTR